MSAQLNSESALLTRIVEFQPAFDKRPKRARDKDYGVHGVNIRFLLKGPLGAVQFLIFTNWQLSHVAAELEAGYKERRYPYDSPTIWQPIPADLGYHSPKPLYDGQEPMDCDVLPEGVCYYDGSGLRAKVLFEKMLVGGDTAVWEELENEYHLRFTT